MMHLEPGGVGKRGSLQREVGEKPTFACYVPGYFRHMLDAYHWTFPKEVIAAQNANLPFHDLGRHFLVTSHKGEYWNEGDEMHGWRFVDGIAGYLDAIRIDEPWFRVYHIDATRPMLFVPRRSARNWLF